MFLQILFFPIVLALVYLLPYIGVVYSSKNNKRWLGHWMVTLFGVTIISPMLSWLLEDWMVQFFLIVLAVALLFAFSNQKADLIFGIVDSAVGVVNSQVEMVKEKVFTQLKQQKLIE